MMIIAVGRNGKENGSYYRGLGLNAFGMLEGGDRQICGYVGKYGDVHGCK